MPRTLWTQVTANEFTAEVITERGRAGRIACSTSVPPLAKRPRSLLGKKSWPTRSTAENESDLENALDGEISVRRLWARSIGGAKFPPKTWKKSSVAPQRREPVSCRHCRLPAPPQNFQRSLKAAHGYPGGAPRFSWARIPTASGDRFHPQTSVVQLKRSEPSSSCPACHPHTNRARAPRTPYTFIM